MQAKDVERSQGQKNGTRFNNSTVASENKRIVIIIKEKVVEGGAPSLFSKPSEFAKSFGGTAFRGLQIEDIRVNRKANLAVVEISSSTTMKADISKALAVTKIGEHAVTCYIPNRDKYKCGVFGPISPEANLEEMIKDMRDKNKIEIVKLEGLNKRINNNMEPSQSVKIILEEDTLPSTVKCGYFTYPIRPYVYTPTQCF